MKKKQLNYHVGLKAATVYKIVVAVVLFAVLANIVNLSAFYKGSSADLNTLFLQSKAGVSQGFNAINFPSKIVDDLFKTQKVNSDTKSEKVADSNKYAVITKPLNRFLTEINRKDTYFPANELKFFQTVPIDTGQNTSLLSLLYCSDFIMTLLLILLLMTLLPRGVPSNKRNENNYIFTRPVFI